MSLFDDMLKIKKFYEQVYHPLRDTFISEAQYHKLYRELSKNVEHKALLEEVPKRIYKCNIPYYDRPILQQCYEYTFQECMSDEQKNHFRSTVNAKPSKWLDRLIQTELITSIIYGSIPFVERALHASGLPAGVIEAFSGIYHVVGFSSVPFNLLSNRYKPKSYGVLTDVKYHPMIGKVCRFYHEFLLTPTLAHKLNGENITFAELYQRKKPKIESLKQELRLEIARLTEETETFYKTTPMKKDAQNQAMGRKRADILLCQRALAELEMPLIAEGITLNSLKRAWREKSLKAINPIDLSRMPLLASTITKVSGMMDKESYEDLLHTFKLGENKALIGFAIADIATTCMYAANYYLPFMKEAPAIIQGIMGIGAAISFPITWAMCVCAIHHTKAQKNFRYIPPEPDVRLVEQQIAALNEGKTPEREPQISQREILKIIKAKEDVQVKQLESVR